MIRQEWHIDHEDLIAYADGCANATMVSSIEAHLLTCSRCRGSLTARVGSGAADEDRVWAAIAERVDGGNRLIALSSRTLVVSISSPPLALMTTLLAALMVTFVCVARMSDARHATTMLVSFGPLVPLVGARIAFGRGVDPAGMMSAAAPVAAGRVAAMRALVVTIIACSTGVLLSPLTTLDAGDSLVWLLPALALSAISVAIATYVDSTLPAIVFAIAWLVAVGAWLEEVPLALRGVSVDGLVTDQPGVQAVLLAATAGAMALCFVRRDIDPNWRTLP